MNLLCQLPQLSLNTAFQLTTVTPHFTDEVTNGLCAKSSLPWYSPGIGSMILGGYQNP